MQKIISLYQRNYDGDHLVRDEVVPGAEWVLAGEGRPTKKYNGTCCMIKDGKLYKRYDAKKGKIPPEGFIATQDPDEKTGHWPGWVLVKEDDPHDKYHIEAWKRMNERPDDFDFIPADGTYELIGPKINGNPHGFDFHILLEHGEIARPVLISPGVIINPATEVSFKKIKEYLKEYNERERYLEGIVWHHPDGRMVKIKYKDFFKK